MTLKALQYFKILAEIQHFNNAAQIIHVSQPSLSYTISELEKELGVELFDRVGKKVFLNKKGQLFLEYVTKSLEMLDEGINKISKSKIPEAIINIASVHSVSLTSIPNLMEKFYSNKDNLPIKFKFKEGLNEYIKDELYKNRVDLIFCVDKPDNAISYPIFEQELFLVVSTLNPISQNKEVSFKDIINEPFIMINEGSAIRSMIEKEFKTLNVVPNTVFEVNQCNAALSYIQMNLGISIIPMIPSMYNREGIAVIKIKDPEFKRTIFVAWLESTKKSQQLRVLQDFIIESSGSSSTVVDKKK